MSARQVYRVDWYPGSDELIGRCHCGASQIAQDPIELWEWLLAHPLGHAGGTEDDPVRANRGGQTSPEPVSSGMAR